MDIRDAYNAWAPQYDSNLNKTRDLEGKALRSSLENIRFVSCLEIGCGTGKNTLWLADKTEILTAVDFSEEMLAQAKAKVLSDHVQFIQADITQNWSFRDRQYDLVTFSLILEHLENLIPILKEAAAALTSGGYLYIGELHPFKQYTGSKARFDTENGQQELNCFTHHISDFVQAGKQNGLVLLDVQEYFDVDDHSTIPRILRLIFRKP